MIEHLIKSVGSVISHVFARALNRRRERFVPSSENEVAELTKLGPSFASIERRTERLGIVAAVALTPVIVYLLLMLLALDVSYLLFMLLALAAATCF